MTFCWLWTCFKQCEKRLQRVHTGMLGSSYKDNSAQNLLLVKLILEQCDLYRCRVYDIDLKHIITLFLCF